MENFIIHIHLFLTDKESEFTAYQNLKRLKKHGFKILITSPKQLPIDFYQFIDYFYYDTENQLLNRQYEGIEPTVWWSDYGNIKFNFIVNNIQRHGLAVLRSMIKGCQVANLNGFKYIIRFEYDDFFGLNSIKQIKDTAKKIDENNHDFYLFKNDYPGRRSDVSVHLMFYNCNKFIEVFGGIKNEDDYNNYLTKLGVAKQALILEQFILLALKKTNVNIDINFSSGEALNTLFRDTIFNKHQTSLGLRDGVLSDVMLAKINGKHSNSHVYIAAQNMFSEDPVNVYYDVFDNNNNLIHTYLFELEKDYWKFDAIPTTNIKTIKIKHNNSDYHKIVDIDSTTGSIVFFENDIVINPVSEIEIN